MHIRLVCVFLCVCMQSSALEDILDDLQCRQQQQQLFSVQHHQQQSRPVSLPANVDKQSIINDILQMTENNSSPTGTNTQQKAFPGMGPGRELTTPLLLAVLGFIPNGTLFPMSPDQCSALYRE